MRTLHLLERKDMNLDEIYQSSTIKAQDLNGREVTLTINGFQAVDFDGAKKLVLSFAETEKTLVCNKTNGTTIGQLYGSNVDSWIGKRITLFPTQTDWAGSQVACIRVKLQPAAEPAPAPAADPQPLPGTPQRPPADGFGGDSPF